MMQEDVLPFILYSSGGIVANSNSFSAHFEKRRR